jgi:predicted DNA-binding protein with PD1-like motif
MRSKTVSNASDGRAFVLILDPGEEAFAAITGFARSERLPGASLTALGAFERATIGWFDLAKKDYRRIDITEQCEALNLTGDIAIDDRGQQSLHLHAVLGLSDGSTRGGHLLEAIVRPTLEVMVKETPTALRRKQRSDLGLALIDLS